MNIFYLLKVGLGRAWTRPDPRPDPRVFWETRTRPAPFLEDPRQTRAKFLGPETHFSSQNPYLAQICMIFWGKYGPEVDPSKFFRTRDPTRAFLNGPRPDPSQKKETRPSPTHLLVGAPNVSDSFIFVLTWSKSTSKVERGWLSDCSLKKCR